MKSTKIVATIGPASEKEEVIEQMILNGANVFRLNFSHGSHEYHKQNLEKIRAISNKLEKKVGILQDISGPKIRVCALEKPYELKKGDRLDFYKDKSKAEILNTNHYKVSTNYSEAFSLVKEGEKIYLCDGSIKVSVYKIHNDFIECLVENNGVLSSNKGINFPDTKINIDVITTKDEKDLAFGIENDVDFIAISFVQNAHDMEEVRDIIKKSGKDIKIFAKIEKFDAVENIDTILEASDGIMVARGDLGIEVPYYRVPSIQKQIIKKANAKRKPVITATQMLFSLTNHLTATRAEISDVANAVLDGTDAVMLSEESAVGIDPANAVSVMNQTILETENIYPFYKFEYKFDTKWDILINTTAHLAKDLNADAIICLTTSGGSARSLSRARPKAKIITISHDPKVLRELSVVWGLNDFAMIKECENLHELISNAVKALDIKGLIDLNKTYILTAGHPVGKAGSTNLIRVLTKEQLEYYLKF